MEDRQVRLNRYLSSVDWDMKIHDFLLHMVCVNWQGSGKDLLLNSDLFSLYFYGRSIFHTVIVNILKRPHYKRSIDAIYSNVYLNKDVYGDDYYKIDTIQDIRNAENGIIYISDAEKYFNSVGVNMEKADTVMINLINNTRKDGNFLRFSCHRFMSIHVRIRELIPVWILPDMYVIPNSDFMLLNSYRILYQLVSHTGKLLVKDTLAELPKYAGLYDTLEKSMPFSRNDI